MMVTGGQAKAIQRKGLMMAPGAPRIAVPPHRKLDGSSQLLACKYKASKKRGVCLSREFPKKQKHYLARLHQVPYPHQRLAEEKDEDGVEQNIPRSIYAFV